ncbi:hypothetical protein HYV43_01075 [Candidatus Micrarchaeota archaeon]|nr:hypothetical protein [Candidatus Micrarchaeota archaeon]
MANMTLSVPDALQKKMKKYPVKWSEVARKAFERQVWVLEHMDELFSESTLTEEDAERIGHKLKAEIRKRFK